MTASTPEAVAKMCARLNKDAADRDTPYFCRDDLTQAAAMLEALSRALAEHERAAVLYTEAGSAATLQWQQKAERAEAALAERNAEVARLQELVNGGIHSEHAARAELAAARKVLWQMANKPLDSMATQTDLLIWFHQTAAQAHGERREG